MNKTTNFKISASLIKHCEYAVSYALDALRAADPLVPFVITWRDDETTIERYMYNAYDDSIELAMRAVNASDESVSAYAVVWSGYIDDDGKKDAVIIETGNRHSNEAIHLARPYHQKGDYIYAAEEWIALGAAPNLLESKLNSFNMGRHLIKPAFFNIEGFKMDVLSHAYAKMPAAIICLAANLCDENTEDRIAVGLRKLQELESRNTTPLSHRIFSLVFTTAVSEGDLLNVTGSDEPSEMVKIILEGAMQLNQAVKGGLVSIEHVSTYYNDLHTLLEAVLTENGKRETAAGSERLNRLLGTALAA